MGEYFGYIIEWMARRKRKKTFFKIKERLVFVAPKKFFGRKVLGVIFLVSGSLILAASLVYFYLIPYLLPRFFPPKKEIIEIKEIPEPFSAQRVLIPTIGLDLKIKEGNIEGKMPSKAEKLEGAEILVLGKSSYRIYRVVDGNAKMGLVSPTLVVENGKLKLILPVSTKQPSFMSIEAEQVE